MARNRVIYQSEALFVSPNATGAHFTCSALITGGGQTGAGAGAIGSNLNKPALMKLSKPIGLHSDPAVSITEVNATNGTSAEINPAKRCTNKWSLV